MHESLHQAIDRQGERAVAVTDIRTVAKQELEDLEGILATFVQNMCCGDQD